MPSDAPKFYWDSCVFLSAVDAVPERLPFIDQMLSECDEKKHEIFTSQLSISEVCFAKNEKAGKVLDPAIEEKIDTFWEIDSPVKMVEVHETVTRDAKALIRWALSEGFGLKPSDAIYLATAKILAVKAFHTYDHRLAKYSGALGFDICEPRCNQYPMFPSVSSPLRVIWFRQWWWHEPKAKRPDRRRYFGIQQRRRLQAVGRVYH